VKHFFDTNVLVYRFDASETIKQPIAAELVDRALTDDTFCVSTQVMMEFYHVATRKLRDHLTPAGAVKVIQSWAEYEPVVFTPTLIADAAAIHQHDRLSWWDSAIVAAALAAEAQVLYSEDLQHGREFGDLRVQNPFRHSVNEPRTVYRKRSKK
jgi:predicted nucleic acid-binding protein